MALLAIVMSVSFIACSNDDGDDKEASTSLVAQLGKLPLLTMQMKISTVGLT